MKERLWPPGDCTASWFRIGIALIAGSLFGFALLKPLHMDDWVFVATAQQILRDFPHIYAGKSAFLGRPVDWSLFCHPPFVPFFLAGWIALLGAVNEIVLHLVFFLFPVFALIVFYLLCKELNTPPRWTTLFFASSPCFFLTAQSLMSDTPALTFFLLGLLLYVRGSSRNNAGMLLGAGISASLAWLCRYPGFLIVGVMFLHAWHTRRWRHFFLAAALPAATLLAWHGASAVAFGRSHVGLAFLKAPLENYQVFQPALFARRAVAFVSFLGGSTVLPPLFLALVVGRTKIPRPTIALCFVLACLLTIPYAAQWRWERILFFWCCLSTGLLFLMGGWSSRSFSGRWLAGLFLCVVLAAYFACMRHLLLLLPALCFLVVRWVEENILRTVLLVASLLISWGISWVDRDIAKGYQQAAKELCSTHGGNERLYYTGEWGWRYAMQNSGAIYLMRDKNDFQEGDLLAIPEQACPILSRPRPLHNWQLVKTTHIKPRIPLHLVNSYTHAGFYSDAWGLLPYSWSRQPAETIFLYRYKSEKGAVTAGQQG